MALDVKKKIIKERNRNYLVKDFRSFRADLLDYAKTYFPDRISDFSEASVGGMLLDLAAFVGDTMSYYLDHQYNELDYRTAVETENIQAHAERLGVKIPSASPATAEVDFFLEVPAESIDGKYRPSIKLMPKIAEGTSVSGNGITFTLDKDLDFAKLSSDGFNFTANTSINTTNSDGSPKTYTVSLTGICFSGQEVIKNFDISSNHVPFRKITLPSANVSDIISVIDSDGNTYYEVEALSQDCVYRGIANMGSDNELVEENLEILPAPYRFTARNDINSRLTTIQFGGGDAETLEDDIIPDPSELALPLYGKKTFPRFAIDPNSLLKTKTLGISPKNTTISVQYRHSGGLKHNVPARSIRNIENLIMVFNDSSTRTPEDANLVRRSLDVSNAEPARGGAPAPTVAEVRNIIGLSRQLQSRIVNKNDLLARIYTLPSKFGRVFRAGIRSNPNNILATQVFVIARDRNNKLSLAPDALKKNMRTLLNEYRLISDALDILDARVINYRVEFDIVTTPTSNKNLVIQSVISSLRNLLNIENFQIDEPLISADMINTIINTPGVLSLNQLKIKNIFGQDGSRTYSGTSYNIDNNTIKGMVVGPPGSIFELRYPSTDIIGNAS